MAETALELFQRAEQLNTEGDLAAARNFLRQSAELGHVPATFRLAISEAAGLGGPRDRAAAEARFANIAPDYPPARMAHCVARAAGWSGAENWAGAVALEIEYAKSGDSAALIDLALLCLLRQAPDSERFAQALFASALSKGATFAAPALMRLHTMRGERFVVPDRMLKALEQASYLPIGQIERTAKSQNKPPSRPAAAPGWDTLQTLLSTPPAGWLDMPGEPLAPEVSATSWTQAVHPCVCDFVAAYAAPMLVPAEIQDAVTGAPVLHPIRKALHARIASYRQTLAIHALERIMTARAGQPWRHGERLTVLFYKQGDRYAPHADYFAEDTEEDTYHMEESGQRVATTLVSLHAAERGGATHFPHLDKSWNGTTGDILTFRNLKDDGAPNPLSLHEGQVVETGWKTLASLWIRERDYWG
nr:2OG-Fe(II) oxygenase [Hyphomonas sp. Mor2]